ncbi:MAG: VWA domain-containing protein, partial [Bacillota bacterium]|nr:VWA domain-containing protein [Bacillota bacterium]
GREIYALANYIDVQTGSGGGRITGKLSYGLKESLRKSHENHVHLSLMLPSKDLALIFFLVEQVERAIKSCGFELRKIEQVVHETADPSTRQDLLSAYSAYTDSFIKESRQIKDGSDDELYRHQMLDISEILEELDDVSELKQLLSAAHPNINKRGAPAPSDVPYYWQFQPKLADAWTKLQGYGYVARNNDRYHLTPDGKQLYEFLTKCGRQIECDLKQKYRGGNNNLAAAAKGFGHATYSKRKNKGRQSIQRRTENTGTLAIVPTILNSLQESIEKKSWTVNRNHLRFEQRMGRSRLDICLLIDASASMMGKRMKAAKVLAEHLVHSTDDRLSVIYFQEDKVEIAVPFTRNQALLRAGLKSIKPSGLTPLAAGLFKGAQYVNKYSSPQQALMVVITDGIPTMAMNTGDPLQEALDVAETIGKTGLSLCYVGLQPNHKLLDRLAQSAGGSVHIIDEITAPELLRIVEKERREAVRNL